MTSIDPDSVAIALRESLSRHLPPESRDQFSIGPDQNLLELVDSFGFAELILELEAELDIELPLNQVDLASIVHVDRLIGFVCSSS